MKAILWTKYGAPDLLRLGDVEKPTPKDDEVLIKVYAASAMPGDCEIRRFDMHILFWLPVRIYMGIWKPKRPILGMDLAGEIESVGKNVHSFKEGDQVLSTTGLGFGAYAQYKCQKSSSTIALKPVNMTYEQAVTVPTSGINALHYIRKANIKSGQKILIIGAAGCFGTYAVQLAELFGAEVTSIDSTEKLKTLIDLGSDHAIDYTHEDFVKNDQVYDAILDIAGKGDVWKGMKKSLKKKGRYILATPWVFQVIQGLLASIIRSKKFIFALARDSTEDLTYLRELIEAGKLKAVIDRNYPLEQMAEAHTYVESGEKIGHVTINVTHSL